MQQDFLDVPFDTENEEASPGFELLPRGDFRSESRDQNDVIGRELEVAQFLIGWFR